MKKNLSEKQKKLIVKRYLNGETITNLARELNSNRKTIYINEFQNILIKKKFMKKEKLN